MNNELFIESIKEDGNYSIMKNTIKDGEYYIFKKYDNAISEKFSSNIERKNLIYQSLVWIPVKQAQFESIRFSKDIDFSLIKKIYEYILENNIDLNIALNEIDKLLSDLTTISTIFDIRGAIAEMWLIINEGLKVSPIRYSIFDFSNKNIDIEVKSFSKVKQTVQISYQQLINNKNTMFYFVELSESSQGKNIFELYEMLNIDDKKRYSWINKINKKDWNIKFLIGEILKINVENLNRNLSLPEKAIDAKIIYSVEGLRSL